MFEQKNNLEKNETVKKGSEVASFILSSLANTQEMYPDYYKSMIGQRLKEGFGSRYDVNSAEELSNTLFNKETLSNAEEFIPREGACPGCQYFRVPHPELPAKLGIVFLNDVDENTPVKWEDPKGIGENAAIVLAKDFDALLSVNYSTIIVDNSESAPLVATFFPGEPVDMDKMIVKGSKPESTTAKEAIKQGIYYAKTY